jgi:hypothetical protein
MPFLYTSCVLDCALRFLMIFLLLIKKKKKNQDFLSPTQKGSSGATRKKDRKAIMIIHQCLDDVILQRVANATTSKEIGRFFKTLTKELIK